MGIYTIDAIRDDGSVVSIVCSPPERVGTSLIQGVMRTEDGEIVNRKSKGVYEVLRAFGAPYRVTSDDPNAP